MLFKNFLKQNQNEQGYYIKIYCGSMHKNNFIVGFNFKELVNGKVKVSNTDQDNIANHYINRRVLHIIEEQNNNIIVVLDVIASEAINIYSRWVDKTRLRIAQKQNI